MRNNLQSRGNYKMLGPLLQIDFKASYKGLNIPVYTVLHTYIIIFTLFLRLKDNSYKKNGQSEGKGCGPYFKCSFSFYTEAI